MFNLNVQIDKESLEEKPNKSKAIMVSGRITDVIWNVSVEELAHIVGNKGHTFLPAVLDGVRDANHFVSQKIFALDFDGTITVNEFMNRAERYEVKPAFMYETLTSGEEKYKFRAVFINDITIDNRKAAETMIALLRIVFPESDKSCTDVSRMFFGGKKLFYLDSNNQIDIWNVALSAQAYMKSKDATNYARNIQRFAKKWEIELNKNVLCILRRVKEEMEDFDETTNNIIMVNSQESSFFYLIKKSQSHPIRMHVASEKPRNVIKGIKENALTEQCCLCREFFENDLPHAEKFLVSTNLMHLENGRNMFFKAPIENTEKWEMTWEYNKRHQYKAQHCKEVCPYYEECQARTIVDKVTGKIQQIEKYVYGDVKDSEKILGEYLYRAVASRDKDIHLVKAQTAIGKTTAYCNLIRDMPHKTFMVVVPTNILQEQVVQELKYRGVEAYATPNIKDLTKRMGLADLSYEIEELYDKGYGQKVKPRIKGYLSENADVLTWRQKRELELYLDMKKQFDGSCCIVTTHALFLGLEQSLLQQYEIIVDEDILMTIFKNTSSITFEEMRTALKEGKLNEQCVRRICDLFISEDGCAERYEKLTLTSAEIDRIYDQKMNIRSSLVDFLQADSYHVDLQNERVDFFNARKFPEVKMTIVSATAVSDLYFVFSEYRTVITYEVPIAKYKGCLKQYTAHPLSRSNMEQIGLGNLKGAINKITENPDIVSITFKKFSEGRAHYYGNTEGLNIYKGKDIAVIGTPHNIPFIYKLIGVYLGYNADEALCQRIVEHNGYRFKFMTFEDEQMRTLQFYLIESAIEQTIGRARLLRFDCTVYLFSNFPVRQAEIIQEDYLKLERL